MACYVKKIMFYVYSKETLNLIDTAGRLLVDFEKTKRIGDMKWLEERKF